MNHDYAHCLDYTKDCPKECFRAQLQKDIEERRSEFIGVPMTYAHLGGTIECQFAKDKKCQSLEGGRGMSREEAIEVLSDMRAECNIFGDEQEATRYHVLSWAIQEMKADPAKTAYIKDEVAKMPTVDAVGVIRCKDCRYFCRHEFFEKPYFTCDIAIQYMTGDVIGVGFEPPEDWFCADGERREDEDNA